MIPTEGNDHWSKVAGRWRHVGPPLKPTNEEIDFYRKGICLWEGETPPLAIILGVTQELFHLGWPAGASVRAVDHSSQMIEQVWPGLREDAICADWRDIPLDDQSIDVAVSDGGLSMLDDEGVAATIRELSRILAEGGICVIRAYIPPKVQEPPIDVLQALARGEIRDLSALKLRLCMAMQVSLSVGTPLHEVWTALSDFAPDFESLAAQIGWPLAHLKAIDTYRDSPNVYWFHSLDRILDRFREEPGGFELLRMEGAKEEVVCTPVISLRKTTASG